MSRPRSLLVLSGTSAAALAALYVLAMGTGEGVRLDTSARRSLMWAGGWRLDHLHSALLHTVPAALAAAAALVALEAWRGRRARAVRAGAILAGVPLAALGLKSLLHALDPLGGDAARGTGAASFPSGHSAAAFTAVLVAVLLAPRPHRLTATLAGAAYAAAVGVASVGDGGHYPSDVAASYLLAIALAGPVAATWTRTPALAARTAARVSPALLLACSAALAAAGAVYWSRLAWQPRFAPPGGGRESGAVAAALIAALACALVGAYAGCAGERERLPGRDA